MYINGVTAKFLSVASTVKHKSCAIDTWMPIEFGLGYAMLMSALTTSGVCIVCVERFTKTVFSLLAISDLYSTDW